MSETTLTRAGLVEAVYREVGLSRNECSDLIESVLDEVAKSLVQDNTVKISGFGTFTSRSKSQRIGRNPKTGEEVPITPRRVVTFKPSNILKEAVDQ